MKCFATILLFIIYGLPFQLAAQSEWHASLKEWSSDFNQEFCPFVQGEKTIQGTYFFSPAFIYLADKSGAVEPPASSAEYNMDLLDKNVIRKYLEFNFSKITCDNKNFLASAFESNNTDLLNDLLEISIIFFDGTQYAYWNYDILKVKTKYGNEGDESFISYLVNNEDQERAEKWLDMIDRRAVRSMKFIYETNSRQIAVYLMKNDPEVLNRPMQYGPGEKTTFIGFVESRPDDSRKEEWLKLLKTDPARLPNN